MGLCGWIIFGFLAGLIARAIMPGRQGLGLIATTLLGIAGSFMGGFIASVLRGGNWRLLQPSGFIGAVVGAIVLLAIGRMMSNRR
ncbi:GlsB/YeaQ/YmgE family stress response membrane protein [Archangium violaceum]|uniref:GlsB/YeaQ/YmgE family stress response membrane protein n=1 Tax=Archangium violaceum TaxID=83451 RepID=UPI00193B0906|nr:GlsB/YeaQ/YmgE family stress response membrane protein [Archangium violaceum]QRK11731.1 GlsB/YeaQ/YmgE family stress response membrane protein [Archangium violaceum]